MKVTKKTDGATTLIIEGRVDTTTAPLLEREVDKLGSISQLVFDFAGVDYISSAGLRVLLKAQKRMNSAGTMKVIHVRSDVMEVFEMTGFSDVLTIE